MTGLKFFVNTTKSMTKFMTHTYDKSLKFKPKPLLRPFVNTGPEAVVVGGATFFFSKPLVYSVRPQ